MTIDEYKDVHGGPEFLIHHRYSSLMNIAFVTMMYGAAMPILFPVALISCQLLYFMEIYMLHRVYRKPLDYDDTLHKIMLQQLQFAALVSLAINYWYLSNPRFFNSLLMSSHDEYTEPT